MTNTARKNERIVHYDYGDPAVVLRHEDDDLPFEIPTGHVVVQVTRSIIHPGDLQMIEARYSAPSIPLPQGRQPGSEGAGVIADASPEALAGTGLSTGSRVAFFSPGAWRTRAVVPVDSLIAIPDEMSDIVATQLLVNAITARMVLRNLLDMGVPGAQYHVVQSGAASSVGKIITAIARRQGIKTLRLVRSAQSAARLRELLPGDDIISTSEDGWKDNLRDLCPDGIPVAVDAVGGPLLTELTDLVDTSGHILTYGLLSNSPADLRLVVPKALTIKGITLGTWRSQTSEAARAADFEAAIELGLSNPELFSGSRSFGPSDLRAAVHAVTEPGKTGNVILTF